MPGLHIWLTVYLIIRFVTFGIRFLDRYTINVTIAIPEAAHCEGMFDHCLFGFGVQSIV